MADERRLTQQRADGATLLIFYLLALLVVPARFTIAFVPITLPPALFVALCLAVLWFAAHLVDHLASPRAATRSARCSASTWCCT